MTDPEVYMRANVSKQVFSTIRRSDYHPKKNTILALAVALKLSLEETNDLLSYAGYTLSRCDKGDLIVSYYIEHKIFDVDEINMLNKAFAKIPDNTNLILHSDQGWQYQHKHYQQMLVDKGIRQSMSRKGNCLDNACAENFFSLLKTELLYLQEFTSVEHFILGLTDYIDWYNNKRIKLKLDGLSPVGYRHRAA